MISFELVLEFIKYHNIDLFYLKDSDEYLFCGDDFECGNCKIKKLCITKFDGKLPCINKEELNKLRQSYPELFV